MVNGVNGNHYGRYDHHGHDRISSDKNKKTEKNAELGQLLGGQTQPPQTINTVKTTAQNTQTAPISAQTLPSGIMSTEQLTQMANAPYPPLPPLSIFNPVVGYAGLPTLPGLA